MRVWAWFRPASGEDVELLSEGAPIRVQALMRPTNDRVVDVVAPADGGADSLAEYIEIMRPVWDAHLDDVPAVLAGRLEAVRQERDALRARVAQLLDERAGWVRLLERVMAERDAAREGERG